MSERVVIADTMWWWGGVGRCGERREDRRCTASEVYNGMGGDGEER